MYPTTECPARGLDLVFVLDASGSVGFNNFQTTKAFAENVTNTFAIGPQDTQVGAIVFSNFANISFQLNSFTNRSAVVQAIREIVYFGDFTNTADALRTLRLDVLTTEAGARPQMSAIPRVAIVVTDGGSTQTLIQKMDRRVEGRHGSFPHPHFQSLLNRFSADRELTRRLKEWADGAPVIAFLSNMRPEQGFDDLLSSLPSLDAQLADWRLLVVSSTVPRRRGKIVESHLAEFGFRERCWCRWEPYSYSDLKAYLDAASLVVTPYRSATQSGVLAMAAAAGLPAVATEVGGLPEMMHSGVNGELVPAENPARLAQAIVTVIGNLDRYRRGARACRDTLYSPRQAVAAIVDALRAVSG